MAQNKKFRFGPLALTNAATNLLNPPTVAGGVNGGTSPCVIYLTHIRVVNKTGANHTVSLYLGATGATAAGTEVEWNGTTVGANSYLDAYFPPLRIDSTDFLVGLADANTALTIQGEGEIGVSG